MRQAMGTAVFFGMLGVTFFGVFFTPVFYNVIRKVTGRNVIEHPVPSSGHPATEKRGQDTQPVSPEGDGSVSPRNGHHGA